MKSNPAEILMVEDNPADVRLVEEAFKKGEVHSLLRVVNDGVEAIAYLRRQPPYADASRPDLIFLDLNLTRKDGREVLAEIKADPVLKSIPVVILTTSQAETDIRTSYDLHANCYIVKPLDVDKFIGVILSLEHFWLTDVMLPR